MAIWSNFETQIFVLCDEIKRDGNYKIGVKDFGDKIEKCHVYLKLVVDLDKLLISKRINEKWSELSAFQLIRNRIVHNDSIISENDMKKLNVASIKKHFIINSQKVILVKDYHALEYFLKITNNFLDEIIYGYIFKHHPENHDWLKENHYKSPY